MFNPLGLKQLKSRRLCGVMCLRLWAHCIEPRSWAKWRREISLLYTWHICGSFRGLPATQNHSLEVLRARTPTSSPGHRPNSRWKQGWDSLLGAFHFFLGWPLNYFNLLPPWSSSSSNPPQGLPYKDAHNYILCASTRLKIVFPSEDYEEHRPSLHNRSTLDSRVGQPR